MGVSRGVTDADAALPRGETLLRTKVAPPVAAAGLIDRPEILERVSTWAGKLILVSATAGWGKSSLLSAWYHAQKDERTFAFVHLEPSDDDPALFWSYVIEALRTAVPGIASGTEPLLNSPEVDPTRLVIPELVNELSATEASLVLILDDFHTVGDVVTQTLEFFIDHLPHGIQVVISTRSDPALALSALRARGDLLEVRARHLGFDSSETRHFLAERFGRNLDLPTAELLQARTEGWPAGLQLAGISMESAADPRSFVERFAGDDRNVAAYLVGEVLASIPTHQRDFLLATSVLDELCEPLCDTVVKGDGSGRILGDLERSGLFVVPLDTRREWYRYNRLFADWLRHELRREHPEVIPELHRRAANWHDEHGRLESAIDHALRAGDQPRALALLERYLQDWLSVQWARVARWMPQIDESGAAGYPMIAIANVWIGFFAGDFPRGLRWLRVAEESIDSVPDQSRLTIRRYLQVFRGVAELASGGDPDLARELSLEVADAERPYRSHLYVAAIGNAAIAAFWTTGPLAAVPLLLEAQQARAGASLTDYWIPPVLAMAHAELGSWAEAEQAAEATFDIPPPPSEVKYPYRMGACLALGRVLLARGERNEAIEHIERGLELARTWPDPIGVAYALLVMAEARSDFHEKRALVREAREIVSGRWGRGRILDLVAAAESKLDIRRPVGDAAGTVYAEELTEREAEVLRRFRSDLSLREIGEQMYISHNTVKSYTKAIYRKLGVTSRAAAVETAIELDLL